VLGHGIMASVLTRRSTSTTFYTERRFKFNRRRASGRTWTSDRPRRAQRRESRNVEDNAGQQGAVGLLQIDAARATAVQARTAAQAQARESRRADAHERAVEALAGVFQKRADIDAALRAMTARACVALRAERCSFLHRLAPSDALLYEFEVAPAGPMALPARGLGHADLCESTPRPSVKTTASRLECSATCNSVTLLRSQGWPTAAHVFLHRIGDAEPLGILSTYRAEGRPFTPEDILLLDAIADRVALALIQDLSQLPRHPPHGGGQTRGG